MLSYAYHNLQQNNYDDVKTEDFENIHDLFAKILSKGMTEQLKHGLYREYIEVSEALSTLRGKINIRESIQLKMREQLKLSCIYDELSENNYMNQILKATTLYLIYHANVQRKNKDALKKALLFLSNVDKIEPKSIRWNSLNYTRHNSSYRMLMNLCYIVLYEFLQTTEEGLNRLAVFTDDQKARLFEKFVLEYYKKHFPQLNPNSPKIDWDIEGNADFLPEMRTDIMLTRLDGRKLIIDTKYYGKVMTSNYDKKTLHSHNLYQIFTYVKNEDKDHNGNVDGLLLYAKTDDEIELNQEYVIGGNRICVRTIDLNVDFDEIKRQLDEIVENKRRII